LTLDTVAGYVSGIATHVLDPKHWYSHYTNLYLELEVELEVWLGVELG
jgi:hypothetical protein